VDITSRVLTHNALSVKQFLTNNQISVLHHPHPLPKYTPDHTSCEFWLFPKLKSTLKEIESVEALKTKSTEVLKALQKIKSFHTVSINRKYK
jgi:hypothetical protein